MKFGPNQVRDKKLSRLLFNMVSLFWSSLESVLMTLHVVSNLRS